MGTLDPQGHLPCSRGNVRQGSRSEYTLHRSFTARPLALVVASAPLLEGTRQGILQGAGQGTLVLSLMFGFQAEAVRQALARNSKSPEYGL